MLKILIIDDEDDYCMILKSYFLQRNCEVFLALTLNEGIELLKKNHPDVLFLDNNLPDGNGWKSVDDILIEMPSLKIYLISAYKQKSDFKTFSSKVTIWEKPISLRLLENVFDNPSSGV